MPNGDGTSCLAVATSWAACDHASTKTGILNERQTIVLTGSMTGTWQISYNGATTASVSVFATEDTLSTALKALPTIGSAVVTANITTVSNKVAAVIVYVEFSRETGTFPYHLGNVPLLEVVSSSLTGVSTSTVSETCAGVGRTGHTYEEQTVTASTTAHGTTFKLSMNATGDFEGAFGISPDISTSSTAAEFSAGLEGMVWSGLQEGDTFELSNEFFEVFKPDASVAEWTVRFFFAPASDGLLITVLGDVPPLKQYNASDTTVVVSVNDDVTGVVPASAMPVSAVESAASAGTEAVETASVVVTTAAEVVEVSHVCGNGLRTTAEGCDDGDLVDGDGCSGNCTVESGFVCSTNLNQVSTCYVPETPTLYFEATSFGPFREATSGVARVRRMGYNGSTVTARVTVAGSTATSSKSENDDCATTGDFDNSAHIITLAPGEAYADVEVPIFRDYIWEQALSATERFVVMLASADGADIDSERAQAFVKITDVDPSTLELGWCLTVEPTFAPTARPTHVPTHDPTREPTPYPTRLPTVLPTLSLPPSSTPTAIPTITPEPTPLSPAPTAQPVPYPTPLPSNKPTHAPTFLPTAAPSEVPTQSHPPSPLPSRPSQQPTVAPSPLWIGVSIKASSAAVFNGYNSVSAFDDDQKRLFKKALVDSVGSLASVDDVEVTQVALFTGLRRRLSLGESDHQHMRRKLATLDLEVAYTMTVTKEGTTDSDSLSSTLENELTEAFDDSSGTSTFTTSLSEASTDLNVVTTASLDSNATTAFVSSMEVVVVRASSVKPTALPTSKPSQAPSELPAIDTSSSEDGFWGLSSLALILFLVAAVFLLVQGGCLLARLWRFQNQEEDKASRNSFESNASSMAGMSAWESAASSRKGSPAPKGAAANAKAESLRNQVSLDQERTSLGMLRAEITDLENRALAQERAWRAEQASRASNDSETSVDEDRALAFERARIAEREQVLVVRRRAVLAATAVERLEAEHAKWAAALAEAQESLGAASNAAIDPSDKQVNMRGRKVTPLPVIKKKPPNSAALKAPAESKSILQARKMQDTSEYSL